MSSGKTSSANSSRSNSRSRERGEKSKGKSIMKKAFERIRKSSEDNFEDIQVASTSGAAALANFPGEENLGFEYDLENNGSDNGSVVDREEGRGRTRERPESNLSNPEISTSLRAKHVAYTRANPLGQVLLNMAADNLALQQHAGITESNVNAGELCSAFYSQMEMERKLIRKELSQVAEKTEERILSREFDSLCVNSVEKIPSYFSKQSKLNSNAAKVDAMRIFPVKSKFSGNMSGDSQSISEFLGNMNFAQEQMKLTESEFLHMLLMCTSGKAHELCQQWVDQGEGIKNIYFNLCLQYDRRITPENARQKLITLMVPKNIDLPKHISHIMMLADRASYALPQGPSRTAFYNNEAINALMRSLPPASRIVCSNLFHSLSAKARRAVTFLELSRSLNTLRHTIDLDIKENGAGIVANNKAPASNSKGKKGSRKVYTSYAIDATSREQDGYVVRSQQQKARHIDGSQPALVYQVNTKQYGNGNFRGNQGGNPNTGKQVNQKGNTVGPSKSQGTSKYCSLCGKGNHTAADGCRNMKDNNGKIIQIQPAQNSCNVCPATVVPRLNHPPFLCPFRPMGPLHGTR